MKEIKAWAVCDEKGKLVLSKGIYETEGQIVATSIGEFWEVSPFITIPLYKGHTVRQITITWEE